MAHFLGLGFDINAMERIDYPPSRRIGRDRPLYAAVHTQQTNRINFLCKEGQIWRSKILWVRCHLKQAVAKGFATSETVLRSAEEAACKSAIESASDTARSHNQFLFPRTTILYSCNKYNSTSGGYPDAVAYLSYLMTTFPAIFLMPSYSSSAPAAVSANPRRLMLLKLFPTIACTDERPSAIVMVMKTRNRSTPGGSMITM